MTAAMRRALASGLDRTTTWLLVAALALSVLHHADHVLRVDHSGWPFRPMVTPFTFSLLAYPIVLFALLGPRRLYWLRWASLLAAAGFVLFAHTAIENPHMQYFMWAENRSLDRQGSGLHNMAGVESPLLGALSVAIGMALNVAAVVAVVAMFSAGRRRAAGRRR